LVQRVARATALSCVAIATLFAIWKQSWSDGLSVLGGGLLIAISFWAITSTVDDVIERIRAQTGRKSTVFTLVKFFTRHGIVALAAYGMMVRLHLDALGLLAGVSSFGLGVAVEAFRDLRWRRFP
jgi:hypothetical protein